MLLRLLFVLLIALNIAVAAWLLLGDTGTHAVDPTDSGVPKLKLLAEVPAGTSTAPAVADGSPGTASTAASGSAVPAPASVPAAPPSKGPSGIPVPATPVSGTSATSALAAAAATAPPTAPKAEADTTPAEPEAPVSPRRSYKCLAIGPFANQVDLRTARTAIAPRTVRSRQRQETTSESHGWRVFLPSQTTRELALAQARRLEAKGIKDYFVVTAQGELQNSVALGLFHDPANARKRRDEVIAAGFPARMSERTETTPVWWLDVVVPDDGGADIRRSVRNPAVSARPTGCF